MGFAEEVEKLGFEDYEHIEASLVEAIRKRELDRGFNFPTSCNLSWQSYSFGQLMLSLGKIDEEFYIGFKSEKWKFGVYPTKSDIKEIFLDHMPKNEERSKLLLEINQL